jgi:hypothetical protein
VHWVVLAVGQAPEANTSVAVRTLVTPEINPAAKPSDASAEATQPHENGSAPFHVIYSSDLNGARDQENDKAIKSDTARALPGPVGSPPASQELARTPEPIVREKQPRRDQAESNRGARPGVRPLREAQQPQTSGDQELQHNLPPSTTRRRGGIARRQQEDVRPYAARTYAAEPSPFFQSW